MSTKLLTITIAVILMLPQNGACLRPISTSLSLHFRLQQAEGEARLILDRVLAKKFAEASSPHDVRDCVFCGRRFCKKEEDVSCREIFMRGLNWRYDKELSFSHDYFRYTILLCAYGMIYGIYSGDDVETAVVSQIRELVHDEKKVLNEKTSEHGSLIRDICGDVNKRLSAYMDNEQDYVDPEDVLLADLAEGWGFAFFDVLLGKILIRPHVLLDHLREPEDPSDIFYISRDRLQKTLIHEILHKNLAQELPLDILDEAIVDYAAHKITGQEKTFPEGDIFRRNLWRIGEAIAERIGEKALIGACLKNDGTLTNLLGEALVKYLIEVDYSHSTNGMYNFYDRVTDEVIENIIRLPVGILRDTPNKSATVIQDSVPIEHVVLLADYDNSTAPGDTPIDQVPENLKWFVKNLKTGNTIIVHTGRDKPRILRNLITPLRKVMSESQESFLSNLIVVHDNGSGAFGFDKQGGEVVYLSPSNLAKEDIDKIIEAIIEEFFEEFSRIALSRNLAGVEACRQYALAELARIRDTEDWLFANQEGRPAARLRLIPERFRDGDGFGDIFIWNKGNMLTLEFDYVNKDLGIGERTGNIKDRVKAKLGEYTSGARRLYYNSHFTAVDISLGEKGPTVAWVFDNIVRPKITNRNTIAVSMGDNRSDFTVFALDFEGISHIKVFLGGKDTDIQDALRFEGMIIASDKLSEGGKVVLQLLSTAHGKTLQDLTSTLRVRSEPNFADRVHVVLPVISAIQAAA